MAIKTKYMQVLKKDLVNNINIFTGAGFSIEAQNKKGEQFPLGAELKARILKRFKKVPITDTMELPMMTMMVSSLYPDELRNFLTETFRVHKFDEKYVNLRRLKLKYFFTTNIDDLPQRIFEGSGDKFLNNVYLNSINKHSNVVNFFPVHGHIDTPDKEYIFDTIQLADTGNDSNIGFTVLMNQLLENPIIFMGYSFNDLFAWRAIKKLSERNENNTNIWVLLREEEEDKSIFFEQLGFKVILGNTSDLLELIGEIDFPDEKIAKANKKLLPEYSYQESIKTTPHRRVEDFYEGFEPTWNQIIQSSIKPLSTLSSVEDKVYMGKNIVITGMIFSGKTTIAMQLMYRLHQKNMEVYFLKNSPTEEEAKYIINSVKGHQLDYKPIIIIDDFCSTVSGIELLLQSNVVQIIGLDRFYNYDSLQHRFMKYKVEYTEITELSDVDASMIWDNIPVSIKNNRPKSRVLEKSSTVLELIDNSLKKDEQVKSRVKKMLDSLKSNPDLLELLVLAAYFQRSKSYLSMDVLIAYFENTNYKELFSLIKKLRDQIFSVSEEMLFKNDQDYYVLRSTIYAFKILDQIDSQSLKNVILKVAKNVPNNYIYRYDIFRKYAYDSELIKRAFYQVKEGLHFYEIVYKKEPNIYTYQHAAIYASMKGDFDSAFKYIDRAMSESRRPIFSVQNVYATILFKANIGKNLTNTDVIEQLHKSMSILEKCINDSQGKAYHTVKYAEQAIEYFKKSTSVSALKYLENAEAILEEQLETFPIEQKKNIYDMERNLNRIKRIKR